MAKVINNDKAGAYILGIVGIVAAVGLIVAIMGAVGGSSGSDISGAVTSASDEEEGNTDFPEYTQWTTCLDQGNMIKLGNHEGGTFVKKDFCTETVDKMIAKFNHFSLVEACRPLCV